MLLEKKRVKLKRKSEDKVKQCCIERAVFEKILILLRVRR